MQADRSAKERPDIRVLPEAALVLAAQARDRAAFTELVRRREAWLRALLKRLTGNASEADDLAQDVFLQAWKRLHALREAGAFGGWLRRLAVNLFIDARRIARETAEISEDAASEDVAPERTAGARIDLERALALLSPAERLCVTLNLGEGLSHGEIAETAGLPLGTVKSHVKRATDKLRRRLGENTGGSDE
jgi:RNA polymerase sigma factor (sigma-70 family)